MKIAKYIYLAIYLTLGLVIITACTNLSQEKNPPPESKFVNLDLGSISGIIRTDHDFCGSIRVFAHEIKSGQITDIQTQEGDCIYTIPNLPVGSYLVVGWAYPSGASGAYTSLETVMANGLEEAQTCKEAIISIPLKPGEDFSGADIGCWGSDFFDIAAPHGQVRLEPNRWKLTELEDQVLIPGTGIMLIFEAGKFSGSAGCNNYGGTYTTSPGGGLTLNEIEKNAMLCTEPIGIMEQEEHFFTALISTRRYLTLNEELELLNEDGIAVLKFTRVPHFSEVSPEDFVGKTWRLVAAPGLDGVDLGEFTLSFDGYNFSGTTACRDYTGTYMAVNDRLKIGYLEMTTDVPCAETLLNAEGSYTTLLENIEQYNVRDTQLEFYTLKGEEIIFNLVADKE